MLNRSAHAPAVLNDRTDYATGPVRRAVRSLLFRSGLNKRLGPWWWRPVDRAAYITTVIERRTRLFEGMPSTFSDAGFSAHAARESARWGDFHERITAAERVVVEPNRCQVIGSDGRLVSTFDPHRGLHVYPSVADYAWRKTARWVDEAIVFDGSAGRNLYHFVVDSLMALAWLEEEPGLVPADLPLIVNRRIADHPFFRYLRERSRWFDQRPWIVLEPGEFAEVGRAYNVRAAPFQPELWSRVRALYGGIAPSGQRRLFVSRDVRRFGRGITNEAHVSELLASYGFETYYPERFTLAEQQATFEQADFLVGLHGMALVQQIFMPAGEGRILELMPRNRPQLEYTWESWTLERQGYDVLVGSDLNKAMAYSVDPVALQAKLERLLALAPDERRFGETILAADPAMSIAQDLALIWHHLPARRRVAVGGTALLVLVGGLAEAATVGALLPLLAFFTAPDQLNHIPLVGPWLLSIMGKGGQGAVVSLFCLVFVIGGAIRLWLTYAIQATAFGAIKDINVAAFARVVRQPYPFYNRTHSADLISRFEKTHALAYNVVLSGLQAVAAVVLCLALLALLLAVNTRMALVGGGSLILAYVLVSLVVRRPLHRNAAALASVWGKRVQVVQEALGGIRDILLDQSQRAFEQRMDEAADQTRKAMILNSYIGYAPRVVVETVLMLFVAGFGFYLSRQPGGIGGSLPALGVMALGAMRLLPQVQTAFQGWSAFIGNQKTLEEVTDLLRLPLTPEVHASDGSRFSSELRLERVSFAYDRMPTLVDVDLTIRRGERIGIVGPTGSGKSTLMDLLLGLLEPDSGALLIDGAPARGERRWWWQAQVAHVPQAIFLLDGTIRQNVAFGLDDKAIDDALVRESLAAAGLATLVTELPDGVQTMVGERGARLSGGQRQRLGIARALYKRASVLVFDEATSALDSETEAAVMQAIAQLPGTITIIMIAHRLGTLTGCDRIVVLEKGRIARIVGSIAELV